MTKESSISRNNLTGTAIGLLTGLVVIVMLQMKIRKDFGFTGSFGVFNDSSKFFGNILLLVLFGALGWMGTQLANKMKGNSKLFFVALCVILGIGVGIWALYTPYSCLSLGSVCDG